MLPDLLPMFALILPNVSNIPTIIFSLYYNSIKISYKYLFYSTIIPNRGRFLDIDELLNWYLLFPNWNWNWVPFYLNQFGFIKKIEIVSYVMLSHVYRPWKIFNTCNQKLRFDLEF